VLCSHHTGNWVHVALRKSCLCSDGVKSIMNVFRAISEEFGICNNAEGLLALQFVAAYSQFCKFFMF
jgi:hypothetical protein